MASQYSDLEAVRENQQPGLEHDPMLHHQVLPDKYNAQYSDLQHAPNPYGNQNQYQYPAAVQPAPQKLWGLAPKTFWIVFAIISIIVIGAAVGGGVGASQLHKSSTKSTANTDSSTSSAPPTSATSNLTPSLTTTPVIGPSATLLRDCPSSNNTLLTVSPNPSNPQTFRKLCSTDFLKAASVPSTENVVNTQTTSLNDCIGLCAAYNEANKTSINDGAGYVCNAVCWRNGFVNDDFPGNCFGFTTANSTDSLGTQAFDTTADGECDGAGWIDQRQLQ
ncbi:hypothetical protein L207DRAFT_512301 [Hyaloscypha variabilis F]|uniref:Apple domain-containing protein n=1 Tax=Hyaloscypha variabilis (strain UAMH 11265 / GT02V1 / F) TaxID=1149755 RepID=A0A2J6RQS1_HYAVF|nr:hypothetical protein L207DRAFT_512301 [Hyaloscypha variabilis F]